jgi:putative transposase
MAHSFTSLNIHFVFSTKNRKCLIDDQIKSRLWEYMGGIAKQQNMKAIAIGGTSNHIHMLVSLPAAITPAKSVQLIKSNSSKWVNEEFPNKRGFCWQVGYSGFSVSPRQIQKVINYINAQEECHRIKSFEEEYIGFLQNSGISYEERFVWG